MGIGDLVRGDLIAAVMPHVCAAIDASPCTCADLRPERILEMVLAHGLDPLTRLGWFMTQSRITQSKFWDAMAECKRNARLDSIIKKEYIPEVPENAVPERNRVFNSLFLECGIAGVVRECEELAVAYSAALRYAWTQATVLTRFTRGEGELECMLESHKFLSINNPFVSTSITRSPWFVHYDIFYTIKVTDAYRRCAVPLVYTSHFATTEPEKLRGFKPYTFFEDEVRMPNGTPIEPGTIDITFRVRKPMAKPCLGALAAKYAPLGQVHAQCRG